MKDIRIEVQTYDGCITIWYERSKLKNACDTIHNRVLNQLAGLNLKRVEVSVIWLYNRRGQLSRFAVPVRQVAQHPTKPV